MQNNRLVTFHMCNSYECARCIPFTQLMLSKRGDGAFVKGKRPYWSHDEHFSPSEIPCYIREERKKLKVVDLQELRYFGGYGMKWRSGETRKQLTAEEKERLVNITPQPRTTQAQYLYVSNFRFYSINWSLFV